MTDGRYRILLRPSALAFTASPTQDLLSAAAEAGIAVPSACRNGVCELCEARLVAGRALNTRTQQTISPAACLMLCRSQALGPLELENDAVMAAGQNSPQQMQATVVEVRPISHDVYRVELKLPRRRELNFHAGQYLSVLLPDCEPSYFSIASSPSAQHIELHIQAAAEWQSAQRIIDALKSADSVTIEMPHGKACLAAAPDKPLLLIAAGTGFAQMKSLIDYLRETGYDHPIRLYWGVRRQDDMYLQALAQQWQEDWPPFTFVPVVGDSEDNDWSGHHDQLVRAVLASGADWRNVEVHASGSPTMVYALMDALLAVGLPESAFFSDVLEYAPRQ
ncbi:MAG: FAD-binding oxidoreductase [Marinobacter sp.]|uniref:2Fe-2S iron-sulfur cluster-binding protein n=1 Tax=Marinobacter sp. TaxID=50741 RepID=UPI00299EB7A2|nr:2Fe-2S iron-sulfur cluster-binding protein [Marinobacter sp.]MDX1755186.1 FAD-binding oxidoreductase [Marinobacter sp.]